MMKKLIFVGAVLVGLVGCSSIDTSKIKEIAGTRLDDRIDKRIDLKLEAFFAGKEDTKVPDKTHAEPVVVAEQGSQQFLWKPMSESNGKLIVLLPAKYNGITDKVLILKADQFVEAGIFKGVANGNRPHWKFKKRGGDYGKILTLRIVTDGGTKRDYLIPNGSQRVEK